MRIDGVLLAETDQTTHHHSSTSSSFQSNPTPRRSEFESESESESSNMAAQGAQPFRWRYDELDDKNFLVHGRALLLLLLISLAVLLSSALLFLYLRWACRRHRRSASAPTLRPAGLDARIVSSLPVRLHRAAAGDDEAQCAICIGGLVDGEKVKALPGCEHSFHAECVDEWLRAQASCPLCRAAIDGLIVA